MIGSVIATALWAMLPAYLPNNVAVLAGGSRPLDGGRTLGDQRLLGDGKTYRGTAAGVAAGVVTALLLNQLSGSATELLGVSLPTFPPGAMIGLACGAVLGDIAASFLKRRTGRARGASFPGLDQLDFVVGALLVTAALTPEWTRSVFTLEVLVVVLVITPILHVGTNAIAYGLGLKEEPW